MKSPTLCIAALAILSSASCVWANETVSEDMAVSSANTAVVTNVSAPAPTAADVPLTTAVSPAPAPEAVTISQDELNRQLWDAAHAGNTSTVQTLLGQGASPNIATKSGETALHAATAAGSLPTVVLLVNNGANVNSVTSNGWTPLHHAARFGRADVANFLIQHGANPKIATRDNPPKTPVQMAVDRGDLRIARMLGY